MDQNKGRGWFEGGEAGNKRVSTCMGERSMGEERV